MGGSWLYRPKRGISLLRMGLVGLGKGRRARLVSQSSLGLLGRGGGGGGMGDVCGAGDEDVMWVSESGSEDACSGWGDGGDIATGKVGALVLFDVCAVSWVNAA